MESHPLATILLLFRFNIFYYEEEFWHLCQQPQQTAVDTICISYALTYLKYLHKYLLHMLLQM